MADYIRQRLPDSHVFVAYTRGLFTHAVLIYKLEGFQAGCMDPDGGHYHRRWLSWFKERGPFVCMRKR